jgi:hypothetical protein
MNVNSFSEKLFRFINGRSNKLQLLHVLEKWSASLDESNSIAVAYLDFQKAFDTVLHRRLLHKLLKYGIDGNQIKWIDSFLSSRNQVVTVNGETSMEKKLSPVASHKNSS